MPEIRNCEKDSLVKKADTVISVIIKRLGIEDGVRLIQLKNSWYQIFNEQLSPHMFPQSFSEGELLLTVDSPVWIQNLTYYKIEILKKLSAYGVKNIRFRLGRLSQKKPRPHCRQEILDLSPEDVFFISSLIADIRDEALKEAIRTAAEKSLKSVKKKLHKKHLIFVTPILPVFHK